MFKVWRIGARFAAYFASAFLMSAVPMSAVQAADASEFAFTHTTMPDPNGGEVELGIWAPKATPVSGQRVLIVFSHGTGGVYSGHEDTAQALARAGFVVAALTHTGDNYRDQSKVVQIENRPRQLKLLIDYMLTRWEGHAGLDPNRVGAFGFSAGGFTVLALAGGEPDLTLVRPHCRAHPQYFDCGLVQKARSEAELKERAPTTWSHDGRIKAVVAAAPALGFAFSSQGLAAVTVPVQLWKAEFDHILPAPDYADAVRATLPSPPQFHTVANADHFDFLPPCNAVQLQYAGFICAIRPGFDRAAFHAEFNREVMAFFLKTLGAPQG